MTFKEIQKELKNGIYSGYEIQIAKEVIDLISGKAVFEGSRYSTLCKLNLTENTKDQAIAVSIAEKLKLLPMKLRLMFDSHFEQEADNMQYFIAKESSKDAIETGNQADIENVQIQHRRLADFELANESVRKKREPSQDVEK
ncbi:MAG: hypothetical protein FWE16_00915 [Firmicutes bacterium]|nr:hypothetical protein [Bacillota bacterium]